MSVWRMSIAPSSRSRRVSWRVWMRSPEATGMLIFDDAFAIASRLSGGTGSSTHDGLNFSRSRAMSTAVAGLKRPCISIRISTSGPTVPRIASTSATERFFSARSIS